MKSSCIKKQHKFNATTFKILSPFWKPPTGSICQLILSVLYYAPMDWNDNLNS